MDYKDIAEQSYKKGYEQGVKDLTEMAIEEAFVIFMGEPIIRASKIEEICKQLTKNKGE